MGEIVGACDIHLRVGFSQLDLALRSGHAEQRSLKVGTLAQGLGLQIVKAGFQRLIGQVPHHFVIRGHSVVSEQLPKSYERLCLGEAG